MKRLDEFMQKKEAWKNSWNQLLNNKETWSMHVTYNIMFCTIRVFKFDRLYFLTWNTIYILTFNAIEKNVNFLLLQLKDPHMAMLKATGFDCLMTILSRETLCFQMEAKQWYLKKFMIVPHYMWTDHLIQRLNNIKHV